MSNSYWPNTRESLLERLKDTSDNASWNEFIALYSPPIDRYCRRGFDNNSAADIVQRVFLRLCKSLPNFQYDPSKGSFGNWLGRVTRNEIIKFAVSEQRYRSRHVALADIHTQTSEAVWNDIWNQHIMEMALHQARQRVPARTWELWEHTWLSKDKKLNRLAKELGVSAPILYSTRFQVSQLLKQLISDLCSDYPFGIEDER